MDICELAISDYNKIRRHPWEEARISVIADMLKNILDKNQEKEFHVLDIGCGDAYVAYKLSKKFPRAKFYCVDTAFTPDIKTRIQEKVESDRIVLFEKLEEVPSVYKGKADFVFLFDVIEHIEDDIGFLKYLSKNESINEATQIFITVPAFQALFSKHDVFLKHFRRHTTKTLEKTVEKSGFQKITSGYFFFVLLIPRLVQKMLESKTRTDVKGIGNYQGGMVKTLLIKSVLLYDYFILNLLSKIGIKIPGLSCYIVCKKKH